MGEKNFVNISNNTMSVSVKGRDDKHYHSVTVPALGSAHVNYTGYYLSQINILIETQVIYFNQNLMSSDISGDLSGFFNSRSEFTINFNINTYQFYIT
ncbi:hypothetical protein Xmau_00151 [Xenorhabdus mauleonii]|uniref:Uncharacterized protein n=1 Tax=Xenorhabdus mauleonii TaxID=351675 RepID=A0A1I3N6Y0_9GAMM|nr:hypothetical protein [Xenorhabdus mauleonii]PHM45763.1 hypothetical protein Xmau_00151 [Xenorhabdus mauleonii]SFJ05031.1 hypothetical protein SAMN05421680_105109 [Xenorhabdus mauleonii]